MKKFLFALMLVVLLSSCAVSKYGPANEYGFEPVTDGLLIEALVKEKYPEVYRQVKAKEVVVETCIVYYDASGNKKTHLELRYL